MYNEEEIKRICEKYDIETEIMPGYPTFMGKEMDDKFSMEEIIKHPIIVEKD